MDNKIIEGAILAIGNPLLDIIAHADDEFLERNRLTKHDGVIAEAHDEEMFDDLFENFDAMINAGGSAQNTMRFVQWIIGKQIPATIFFGCAGKDYLKLIMEKKAQDDGVLVKYQIEQTKTGSCMILLSENGTQRSLCTYLGASDKLSRDFLIRNWTIVEDARIFYTTGHHFAINPEPAMVLAKYAHEWGKEFVLNLSSPYMILNYAKQFSTLLPYVDIIFATNEDILAFATMAGYKTRDPKEVAVLILKEPRKSYDNPKIRDYYVPQRTVIITQVDKPVIVARTDWDTIQEFPVTHVDPKKIVSTNGAGDAFTGGFLAMYVQEKPIDVCIKCGIYCATECIQQMGCTFPKNMEFKY